jgi:hypothetical protein
MQSSGTHFSQPPRSMPETSAYYHVAYTVALSIYTLYAVSLYLRRKRLRAS